MMRFYNYMFYRFYKLVTLNSFNWLPAYRATLLLLVLEIWLSITIVGFINLVLDIEIMPKSPYSWSSIIVGAVLIWLKEYCFFRQKKWKNAIKEFDTLPKRKHVQGIIIFVSVIVLIIGSFILMLYLSGKKSGTIH